MSTRWEYHLDDPREEPESEAMQFRLTYAGPLYASGNKGDSRPKVDHKHDLRMKFDPQLKRLWEILPFLKTGEQSGPDVLIASSDRQSKSPNYKASWLAKKHAAFGWRFVPLVSHELDLWCSLDILFLRPGRAGGLLRQGDLDGRLKTLIDALAIPDANQGYESRTVPTAPLYTLLENDRLVSKITVETDELLELDAGKQNENFVRLVISVSIRPYEMHVGNMQFG